MTNAAESGNAGGAPDIAPANAKNMTSNRIRCRILRTPSTPLQIAENNRIKRFFLGISIFTYVPGTSQSDKPGQNVIRMTDSIRMIRNGNVAEYTCIIGFSKR